MLLFYKSVDLSVLTAGLTIPVIHMERLFKELGFTLRRGEKRPVQVSIDGTSYEAVMTNILFDEKKYPTHKDVLQLRYGKNSPLALKLREIFSYTQELIHKTEMEYGHKKLSHLEENQKEFIAIYSTPVPGTIQFDCILNQEFREEAAELSALGELTAEGILDGTDDRAGILLRTKVCKIRRLTRTIGSDLKIAYGYRCQICGQWIGEPYGSNLIHAHHIDYFTKSLNNDATNIMIVCPNHHGIIHDKNPVYDRKKKTFLYPNGYEEGLKLNKHL